jgi:hypothetical protein
MSLDGSLAAVLSSPTPEGVWRLRGDLLELGVPDESRIWPVLEKLYGFLDRLTTGIDARDYSHLASKLDIGAISGVILEHLTEHAEPSERAMRLLSGALSEGLMALATRQHVHAWDGELAAVHRDAAWFLHGELWHWTSEQTPELAAAERRRLLDALMDPVTSRDMPGDQKLLLTGALFQVLIHHYVTELLPATAT